MFTLPVAAGEAVAVDGGADAGWDDAGWDGADPAGEGVGEVAAWADPFEWVTAGRMSQ